MAVKKKFWFEKIPKPIIGLAPMHGITSSQFRSSCRHLGADVTYTEMIAAEAVIRNIPKAYEMMRFSPCDRPTIIQIFGSNPQTMAKAAKKIEKELSPDGIDINFGCPSKKAIKQKIGASQLLDSKKAAKIIKSISAVLKEIPLSVKMRLPSNKHSEVISFVKAIKEAGAKLIVIHGRTANQKYRGHSDWQPMYKIKKRFPGLYVLGNGDIKSEKDLKEKLGNLDGVLIGRIAKIHPEIFKELRKASV